MCKNKYLINNVLIETTENDVLKGIVVYEVIRIIQKKPLFLREHLQRLQNSASMRLAFKPQNTVLTDGIKTMIEANELIFGNIEIQFNDHQELLIKIIPHFYPTETMYSQGVCLGILQAERSNPNAKEKNQSLRDRANALMKEKSFFEVLLIDHRRFVTEGSRSNVFFIKNDTVFTSPTKAVLQGITREKIIEICKQQSIKCIEQEIALDEIPDFDAAFMTGTSPAVLPIRQIEQYDFQASNILTKKIMDSYNQLVKTDLDAFKW